MLSGLFQAVEFVYENIFVVYVTSPNLLYLFELGCPDGSTTPDSITLPHAVEVFILLLSVEHCIIPWMSQYPTNSGTMSLLSYNKIMGYRLLRKYAFDELE